MRLYTFFRSSAAYRTRIALGLKGLPFESVPRHLRRGGGEHRKPDYLAANPHGLIPALEVDGAVIGQSVAIMEYLEERWPEPPLLPANAIDRARVRSMVQLVACDIHPLNNLRVVNYLRDRLNQPEETINAWYRHWIAEGFTSLEAQVMSFGGARRFCFGDRVTMADVCLVPQIYNARRFGCDLAPYPTLTEIGRHLEKIPAFSAAAPEAQPDAEA